jgi:VWFA-related protein
MQFRRVLCLAVLGAMLPAQQSIPADELRLSSAQYLPPSLPVLKAEARLVEVGVVVRDTHGHTVGGFTKDDFAIEDSGKKQAITAFSVEGRPVRGQAPAVAGREPPATAKSGSQVPPPVRAPRFLGLVFDDLTLTADDLAPVRTAAKRFLTHGLQSNDMVGIFFTSKGLVQAFTADPAKLSEAVDHLNFARTHIDLPSCPNLTAWEVMELAGMPDPSLLTLKTNEAASCGFCPSLGRGRGGSGGGGNAAGRNRAGTVNACAFQVEMLARSLWEQIRNSSARTLYGLQAIVDYMAEMPGRRAIVLASSGLFSRTLEVEQEEIIDRALRASVVINSLDAKGLYTQDLSLAGGVPSIETLEYRQNLGTRTQWESNDAMAILASSTGGLFFHNNNDIDLGFRELGLAPEISYVLGFSPGSAPDGKYHKLKVRLKTPGQHEVQARPGYYATIPPSLPAAERRIDKEVLSLSAVDEVASRVAAESVETPGGDTALRVTLHLDVQRLRFATVAGVRMLKLTFIAVLFNEHSAYVAGKEGQAEFALKEETFNRLTSGLDTKLTLVAPPGKYRLRSVVQEGTEGRLSAASQEVEIR